VQAIAKRDKARAAANIVKTDTGPGQDRMRGTGRLVVWAMPGQCVAVSAPDPAQVDLLDADGFLRGRQGVVLPSQCVPVTPAVRVFRNGQPTAFDPPPVRAQDRLLVPLRAIAEALRVGARWDQPTQTAILTPE